MNTIRKFLSSRLFIHALVVLGIVALWGYIETGNKYILLGVAASFAGAVCGSFIRVIDKIEQKQ